MFLSNYFMSSIDFRISIDDNFSLEHDCLIFIVVAGFLTLPNR